MEKKRKLSQTLFGRSGLRNAFLCWRESENEHLIKITLRWESCNHLRGQFRKIDTALT